MSKQLFKNVTAPLRELKVWKNEANRMVVWDRINKQIDEEENATAKRPIRRIVIMRSIAAAVIGIIIITAVILWHIRSHENTIAYRTKDDAFRMVTLPDRSLVTLGANSTIRYAADWNKKEVRELWLNGQARFEVTHLHKGNTPVKNFERFIVHLENGAAVEVLGTVFNVFQRDAVTEISLEQGKVKIVLPGSEEITLKPGELVRITKNKTELIALGKENTNNTDSTNKTNIVQLNNTSVADIVKMIEENFHRKVIVEDASVLSRKMDGVLPMHKEKEVLFILSSILNVDIDSTDAGIITIRSKQ